MTYRIIDKPTVNFTKLLDILFPSLLPNINQSHSIMQGCFVRISIFANYRKFLAKFRLSLPLFCLWYNMEFEVINKCIL